MKMKHSLTILSCLIVFGCANRVSTNTHSWSELKLPGLILELKDPKVEEWYLFSSNGAVAATLGEKEGAICAPLYYWRIKDGFLLITDYDKKLIEKFSLVEIRKNEIVVRRYGGESSSLSVFTTERH